MEAPNSSINLEESKSLLDRPIIMSKLLKWEILIFSVIIILAIGMRYYDSGTRVMSHDETSHVYFSWLLYQGRGYAHDPVTHGPFQFHAVALSYFLLGDSDISARIPAIIFSIATVAFMWEFRRYLGRKGAIIAAILMLISPYMLYYGRYVRNEAFAALFGVIMLWAILRYIETGQARYQYWLTAVTVLHFATKETSYIYTAQALLFLALYFTYQVTKREWPRPEFRNRFLFSLIIALILLMTAFTVYVIDQQISIPDVDGVIQQTIPTSVPIIVIILCFVAVIVALYFLIAGYSLKNIKTERSFDLLILQGTLVLPLLSAFVINIIGWKVPVSASEVTNMTATDIFRMALVVIPTFIVSIVVGLWWNRRKWLINAGIFWGIFIVLYTTFFTNGAGFFTGLVGSLGYWLAQQEVNRGSQPWYYYIAVQIPIYEYLTALGSLIALIVVIALRKKTKFFTKIYPLDPVDNEDDQDITEKFESADNSEDEEPQIAVCPPTLALIGFWVITSIVAYTIAGEKMPWLTVHIAWPMILLTGWVVGYLIDTTDWSKFKEQRGWIVIILLPVFFASLLATFGSLFGGNPPFQGKSLEELGATSTFLISTIAAIVSGVGIGYLMKDWASGQVARILTLTIVTLFGIITFRTAITATYINYDLAKEYLVYAHSAPGVKTALAQIEDISERITGSLDMVVAYDNDTTYPYWWYLRNYTNQRYYAGNPTRDLRDAPAILVGESNFGKIEPVVGQAFNQFDYIRIWWPNQDYYNLTWDRIINAITDPQMREALFQIWFNRDYTLYGELTGKDFSLSNWTPSGRMRLYLRKDIVTKLWDYGVLPGEEIIIADPYEDKAISLSADWIYGESGTEPGQFQNPRNISVSPDGSIYVADTNNHRIQHLNQDGEVQKLWGSFADISQGSAPAGTFYEPWGIAVGPDMSVYVADTWNHRIQKFSEDGEFITMWGFFGQAETPYAFWGPRAVAVDSDGNVYVTDTGNKRVVIFDEDGEYITQFGTAGFEPGQFDEPVGLTVDSDNQVYIADTWNQRIQVMAPDETGNYLPVRNWDVVAWYGQSLDNKPYIAVDKRGHVFITDPEGYRVLEFTNEGEFIHYWGDFGVGPDGFNIPNGIMVDPSGGLWVADSGNARIMHFSLPQE
jgi:predicted membrane-bound mannosyltransferase/DNA-binding beta-propeller fold protein YncE